MEEARQKAPCVCFHLYECPGNAKWASLGGTQTPKGWAGPIEVGVGGGHSRSTNPQPCYDGRRWGLSIPSVSGKLGTGAQTWAPWEGRRGCPRWGRAQGSPRTVSMGLSPTSTSTHMEWPVWSLYILTQPSPLPCCSRNRLVTGGRGYPIPTKPSPVACKSEQSPNGALKAV